jgi:hypothetical protein
MTGRRSLEELKGHAAIRQQWVDAVSAYAAFDGPPLSSARERLLGFPGPSTWV